MEPRKLKGEACFLLPRAAAHDVREHWRGAGQWDWIVAEASDVDAVETLGEVQLHGVKCMAYLCSDGRARAIPVLA